jgi:O-methyltransferase
VKGRIVLATFSRPQARAYLHLLKKTLTRYPLEPGEQLIVFALGGMAPALTQEIVKWARVSQSFASRSFGFNSVFRSAGIDWPAYAETMIGLYRLTNLEHCIVTALERGVPGDLGETGVWRGGASIFMRAVLAAYGHSDRRVWAADSFQGLPKPDAASYPADSGDTLWTMSQLAIPLETVKANFAKYGLLDDQVHFLPGWFRDTLPEAPIDKLAVLRLDGDLYESTIVALRSLYHKVSRGGFVIIDDYGLPPCKQAVDDFRAQEGIAEPMYPIDWTGMFWQANVLPKKQKSVKKHN